MKHKAESDNLLLEPPNISHLTPSKAYPFIGDNKVLHEPQLGPLRPYSSTLPLPPSAPDPGLMAPPPAFHRHPYFRRGTSAGVFLGSSQHSDSKMSLTLIWLWNHLARSRMKVTACRQSNIRLPTFGRTFISVYGPHPAQDLTASPSSPDHLRHKEKRSAGGGVCLYPVLKALCSKGTDNLL